MKSEDDPYTPPVVSPVRESGAKPSGLGNASRWLRFVNHLVDSLIVLALFIAVSEFIGSRVEPLANLSDHNIGGPELIAVGLVSMVYYSLAEGFTGRTLGKWLTNTKVVDSEGRRPDWNKIMLRSLCRLIPFESLSFLDTTGQGFHDKLTGTRVIKGG
jgi:uncharacterized RDD family membrane protein YckC